MIAHVIPASWFLILSAILFLIGVLGFFIKRNIIALLLSVEIMLNAVNLTFVTFSSFSRHISGQIFVFFVLVVAAAEAAVGLALVIAIFRNRESLNVDRSNLLKW
jgi:NADH-quinone oxidoreductase subunit K